MPKISKLVVEKKKTPHFEGEVLYNPETGDYYKMISKKIKKEAPKSSITYVELEPKKISVEELEKEYPEYTFQNGVMMKKDEFKQKLKGGSDMDYPCTQVYRLNGWL